MIKLAIVDDDKLVVQLLSDFFNELENMEIVLQSYSGNSCLADLKNQPEELFPDVLLLDLRMADGDGIMVIEKAVKEYSSLKVIVLSSYYKASSVGYMVKSGVHAFVPKETDKETLIDIIKEVAEKGHYFTQEQLSIIRDSLQVKKVPALGIHPKDELTSRELDVLKLICHQLTAKEIAEKLFVTSKTVETHKGNLLLKTGAKNMGGLVLYAVQNAIVDPNDLLILD